MNTPNSTSEYLFLLRGTEWDSSMSPTEMQETMSRFEEWFERMNAAGTLKFGQPLMPEARIVSGKNGITVTDGPFAESKEAVGGYFLINAKSLEEAVEIAKGCPMVQCGIDVEIRPIAEDCPSVHRLRRRQAEELATGV